MPVSRLPRRKCTVCGTEFQPARHYQRTDKPECRRILGRGHMRWPRTKLRDGERPMPIMSIPGHINDAAGAIERGLFQKRVGCRRYTKCMEYAAGENWDSWTCTLCTVDDPMTPDEWRDELPGLENLLTAVFQGDVAKIAQDKDSETDAARACDPESECDTEYEFVRIHTEIDDFCDEDEESDDGSGNGHASDA